MARPRASLPLKATTSVRSMRPAPWIAALAASGPSDVHGISLIDRGYADFRGKLEALGADFD